MERALVYGLAVAGTSTARALLAHGVDVVVADDAVTDERSATADRLGVELLERPDDLEALVRSCTLVAPAPGVPETHPVVLAAQSSGVPLVSEIELAYRWERERAGGPRPMLAITGTDGKTTTTLLAVEMLRAAGLRSVDAGNTSTPLVDAIEQDLDAFVVEATSFRLAWTPTFRADAAAWLNLAPDHLNWHRSMASYEAAKARVWTNQRPDDVAIGFAGDPVVARRLASAPAGTHRTFALTEADYVVDGGLLRGPHGDIAEVASMRRSLPHDLTNALAAAALCLETGLATSSAITAALAEFRGPPHRLEHLGQWDGVDWYNDSKATTPHAAAAAIRSFDRVVLIAGGYDKGVDLTPMAVDRERVVHLIAIGDTRSAICRAFDGVARIEEAATLDDAVDMASAVARAGDTVLLSPGCASFDQFAGFEARGDHFRRLVTDLHRSDTDTDTDTSDTGALR